MNRPSKPQHYFPAKFLLTLFFLIFLFFSMVLAPAPVALAQEQSGKEKKNETKEEEKLIRAKTEEIVVTSTAPKDKPLASVFTLKPDVLKLFKSNNISEILSFAPGTYVTTGAKAESHVKIRGLDNDKSTLLVDGIPIYEPYFNMYDTKTIPSLEIENIQITKGPSSVLYGPNTLGGIIEVLTRRPKENSLELQTRMGPTSSFNLSGSGSYVADRFAMLVSGSHEESKGYKIINDGSAQLRNNSDYRYNLFSGKFYYFPSQTSEILFQASFYDSSYGIPPATAYYSPRYWRFKDWERGILGLGGTFSIFGTGTLKIRSYYVNYYNVLDSFTDATYSTLSWESTYKNYSAGVFVLGTVYPAPRHQLRFSFNGRLDNVKQQGSTTSPWEHYEHQTYSAGLEDEWEIIPDLFVNGGISVDHLKKQYGSQRTSLNPILGLRYLPAQNLELHFSYSQKSRFPSMRSLYSTTGGNPDLRDELGRTFELGASYTGWLKAGLNLFSSSYRDLITSIRLPDGTRKYVNIGQARIKGAEIETAKSIGNLSLQVQYTYLDARDITDNRKLDLVPNSQLSLMMAYNKPDNFSAAFWVIGVSEAQTFLNNATVVVPSYLVGNLTLEKYFKPGSFFIRVENLFNKAYFTEPGYPVSGRRIEVGFGLRTGL